jgi:hypothetical protein
VLGLGLEAVSTIVVAEKFDTFENIPRLSSVSFQEEAGVQLFQWVPTRVFSLGLFWDYLRSCT